MHELSCNPSTRWQARQFDSPGRREAATEEQSSNNRGTIETFAPNSPRLRLSAPPPARWTRCCIGRPASIFPGVIWQPESTPPLLTNSVYNSRCPPRAFLPAEGAAAQSRRDGMFIANVAPNLGWKEGNSPRKVWRLRRFGVALGTQIERESAHRRCAEQMNECEAAEAV